MSETPLKTPLKVRQLPYSIAELDDIIKIADCLVTNTEVPTVHYSVRQSPWVQAPRAVRLLALFL